MNSAPANKLKKLGAAREIEAKSEAAKWLERAIIACLFVFAAAAPHSIAATQTAWLLGMFLWVVRFAFYPPPQLHRTPLDYALLGFFIFTGVSTLFSYEPMVSVGKLRAASLFTIVYLVAENIPSRRVIRLLALTLVASCMINVLYTVGERIVGRGIKLHQLAAVSPLSEGRFKWGNQTVYVGVKSGDTVLEVDGKPVHSPSELAAAYASEASGFARVKIFRNDWIPTLEVPRKQLLAGTTPEEQLGISGWSPGRDWRAAGFFGHYVTYAEALQLILALAVGMLVALPKKRSRNGLLLALAIAGIGVALMLTVTRASWLAFLISTAVILLLGARRKTVLMAGVLAIPLILAGLFVLQQKRNVAFLDSQDNSTRWRETVWHEGFNLLVSKPRHLLVGVGLDSIKAHWREWGLFENGRLPLGHLHSNLLQIAVERGVPALILWLVLLVLYARMLWQLARSNLIDDWVERAIVLGALGGSCGFFMSGLVHYNWGDSEVVMIFYFIMGLTLAIQQQVFRKSQKTNS
jgi:hypothetical protein